MIDQQVLDAIKQSLDRDPGNGPLWVHYAELLRQAGRSKDALDALRAALKAGQDARAFAVRFVALLREAGELAEALIRAEDLLRGSEDPALRRELALVCLERGRSEEARDHYRQAVAADPKLADPAIEERLGLAQRPDETAPVAPVAPAAPEVTAPEVPQTAPEAAAQVAPEPIGDDEWAAEFDWSGLRVTFADVAGLADVKRQIDLRIIAPFKNPEIYRAFRRQGGGGLLLYGPPGCGKTYVARATAGELDAQFMSVSLHEVVDKYWGESEKMVHALFEDARRKAPAVVFFDEFDALGSSRGKSDSQFFRTLVNQLLLEMDGLSGRNENVLLFAATNMPWNVDAAFRRPGRFDRVLFVPPPDREARLQIMQSLLRDVPGGANADLAKLGKETDLMTGADIKALCEQAVEYALERSLGTGKLDAVTMADFKKALRITKSSATEWLATARNYARYSNEGGHYDDLAEFLRRVGKW